MLAGPLRKSSGRAGSGPTGSDRQLTDGPQHGSSDRWSPPFDLLGVPLPPHPRLVVPRAARKAHSGSTPPAPPAALPERPAGGHEERPGLRPLLRMLSQLAGQLVQDRGAREVRPPVVASALSTEVSQSRPAPANSAVPTVAAGEVDSGRPLPGPARGAGDALVAKSAQAPTQAPPAAPGPGPSTNPGDSSAARPLANHLADPRLGGGTLRSAATGNGPAFWAALLAADASQPAGEQKSGAAARRRSRSAARCAVDRQRSGGRARAAASGGLQHCASSSADVGGRLTTAGRRPVCFTCVAPRDRPPLECGCHQRKPLSHSIGWRSDCVRSRASWRVVQRVTLRASRASSRRDSAGRQPRPMGASSESSHSSRCWPSDPRPRRCVPSRARSVACNSLWRVHV